MRKLKNNSFGITLVELLIAVAILGVISMVIINLNKQAASTQKKFETDIDADFIAKEIAGLLADPNTCATSQLIGKNATATAAGSITNINGKYSVSNTLGYGTSSIKVYSYEISNAFTEVTDPNTETVLVIKFAMPKIVSTTQATIKPRRIKLIITKSGANIATCKSAWTNQQDYWTKTNNDIFYNSGNVAIGSTPTSAKLEVGGIIRPGSATAGSSCSLIGAQAYNASTGAPLFCNGTAWTAVGGAGGTQIDVYKCPTSCAGCSGGAWGYYGCQGQYTSSSTCNTIEYPCNVSCACTYVGKMTVAP